MNMADRHKIIRGLEMEIARQVLKGDIEIARQDALHLAEVRDGLLTSDEFSASLVRA